MASGRQKAVSKFQHPYLVKNVLFSVSPWELSYKRNRLSVSNPFLGDQKADSVLEDREMFLLFEEIFPNKRL